MVTEDRVLELADSFRSVGEILTAIGDETRQHIMIEMMKMGECTGARVGEITERTNLSRPAVSHHLQILKNAGILKVRKEGTMNFYYFDHGMKSLESLIETLSLAVSIARDLPEMPGDGPGELPGE